MRSNLLGLGLCSAVAAVAVAGSANAAVTYLTLTQAAGGLPSTGTSTAFTSEFNYQTSNNKLRMWNAAGSSSAPQQVANPSQFYWGPFTGTDLTNRPSRSWEVIWNNSTKTMTTKIYDTADWTGTASANLSLATVDNGSYGAVDAGGDFTLRGVLQFASGSATTGANFYFRVNARVSSTSNVMTGINLNPRLTVNTGTGLIKLSSVEFNGGNGFVSVVGAAGDYSSQVNNYFEFATVPSPGAAALVGLAGLMARRRKA